MDLVFCQRFPDMQELKYVAAETSAEGVIVLALSVLQVVVALLVDSLVSGQVISCVVYLQTHTHPSCYNIILHTLSYS